MAIGVEGASPVQGVPVRPVTWRWVLRRALIGIAILLVAMGSLAWLTYASIDPELDGAPEPASANAISLPPAAQPTPIDL